MSTRPIRTAGPEHPITIEANLKRVIVTVAGRTVADTKHALTLRESSYQAVQYVPIADVDMSLLVSTTHSSYCPYKGDASYYSIPAGGERSVNAVWTYEVAFPSVKAIAGYLAFYPERVESITEQVVA